MRLKLWAPHHRNGCHLGLTNGTTFLVPNDRAGIEVPAEFRRAAIARGCLPVGMEPELPEHDTFMKATTMRPAVRARVG